ncbi:MAG: protease pro-enzyme activation domain-containing protein [bacterium]
MIQIRISISAVLILVLLRGIGPVSAAPSPAYPAPGQSAAPAARRILRGHIPTATARLKPLSRLTATRHLKLAIGLPLRNQDALNTMLQEIYNPASSHYRQYLTPEQFTELYGPTEQDYQAVIAFAKTNGLTVTTLHPNRVVLDVEGSVTAIENAFQVALQVYQHPNEARTFYATDIEPSLNLAASVLHISGLDDYSLPHPNYKPTPLIQNATPSSGSGPSGAYRGSDFRAAYVPGTSLTGSGQSVGLLQFDGYYASDIATYVSQAGLPSVTLTNIPIDGGVSTPGTGNGEVCLDIEMVISMAPGLSKIIVYEAPNPSPWVDILSRMANDNLAKQLSCSWGGGSPDPTAEQIFVQMALQGQSFFNATGDSDAFTGSIVFPSDSTNITEVGGTTLTTTGPAGAYVSETVWNWGGGQGSSGGISTYYPIPAYQLGVSMAGNQGSTTLRNVPDVALTADNVYVVYNNGSTGNFGGTSCAAPLWAGFIALVNQQAATAGLPPVGFLNPTLYTIGKGTNYAACFHDTTTGDNTSTTSPTKYYAVAGYDLCTGWGTPKGQTLINILAPPILTPRPVFISAMMNDVSGGNGNGILNPGETIAETLVWTNTGVLTASNVMATLTTPAPGVTLIQTNAVYPNIPVGGVASNSTPFSYRLSKTVPAGATLAFTTVLTGSGQSYTGVFSRLVGQAQVGASVSNSINSTDVSKAIPDVSTIYSTNTVSVAGTNYLDDVNVSLRIDHTYDGDLVLAVQHPDGTEVILANQRGGSGKNFGRTTGGTITRTVFDSQAATAIASGSAPFAGTYRPDGLLSNLNGKVLNGRWRLRVSDLAAQDVGTLIAWGLTVVYHPIQYVTTIFDNPPVASNQSVTVNSTTSTNLILKGSDPDSDSITFLTNSPPLHGSLSNFNPSTGGITYTPDFNYNGLDTFTFMANDGFTNSVTATVAITVVNTTPHIFEIVSDHGTPIPSAGIYTNTYGTALTNATSTPDTQGATQYVCTGWTMTNHEPAVGTTNWMVMTLTNDTLLIWQWKTQYQLVTEAGANGWVDQTNQWVDADSKLTITAIASNYYHFAEWSGDTNDCAIMTNQITVPMDQARRFLALFAEDLTTNSTPEWWLASYGLTNDWNSEALADQDQDGMPTWAEWLSDTDPTNKYSVLSVVGFSGDENGIKVEWQGGEMATQFLERCMDLSAAGGIWDTLFTNLPPTATLTNVVDAGRTNPILFYRIRAER